MKMSNKPPTCPVETLLLLIGNKWKILIIRDLLNGTKRFTQIKKSLVGISQKVLTQNLRGMEEDGIITREIYAEVPPRVEYTLTATGQSMAPILAAMAQWGKGYQMNAAHSKHANTPTIAATGIRE